VPAAESSTRAGGEPIRVLQVITSLAGGAGLHAYQLARDLDRTRFDARLVFGAGYPLDARVSREQLPHDVVSWRRSPNPLAAAAGAAELAAVLRRHRPQIVHAHCSLAGVVARLLARCARVPIVLFTVHAFASRDHQPAWRRRLLLAAERAMDRWTDHYCVTTQTYGQQVVARGIAERRKISVIPLGIDVPAPPSPGSRASARERLGLAPGELAIGAAGRFEPQKGMLYVIRALPRVRAASPSARLLLFGDGPLRAQLEREARMLGCASAVRFLGWRDDLASLLPGLDAFCVPSLWESFSYAVLEALAARVPVVASRADALPEVLGHGRRGVLVPPADPEALAQALIALLGDDARRRELAGRGRRHVERELDVETMVQRHAQLYAALVAARSAASAPR
jgi:glycosyltransferase involved in cell wall biosynthesis